jgi:hypothetical protein
MRTGVIRLFRFAGIDVYLHFTWFLVAAIFMTDYMRRYQSPIWGVLEYVSLFVIVLIHEFGHALACRQVGGVANRIVLWPLGGVAFVNPPRRPGAYLWSIAAGPLVNVALIPILAGGKPCFPERETPAPTDAYRHHRPHIISASISTCCRSFLDGGIKSCGFCSGSHSVKFEVCKFPV